MKKKMYFPIKHRKSVNEFKLVLKISIRLFIELPLIITCARTAVRSAQVVWPVPAPRTWTCVIDTEKPFIFSAPIYSRKLNNYIYNISISQSQNPLP